MENNNNKTEANDLKAVFPLCFFIGFLGFLIMWRSDVDFSGIRGFLVGFLTAYILFIVISLLARKEKKKSTVVQVKTNEIIIKETNKEENVEINIVIPKSILNLKNNV